MNVITIFDIECQSIQYIGTINDDEFVKIVKFLDSEDANYGYFEIVNKMINMRLTIDMLIVYDEDIPKNIIDTVPKDFDSAKWIYGANKKYIPQFLDGYTIRTNRYFVFDSANY